MARVHLQSGPTDRTPAAAGAAPAGAGGAGEGTRRRRPQRAACLARCGHRRRAVRPAQPLRFAQRPLANFQIPAPAHHPSIHPSLGTLLIRYQPGHVAKLPVNDPRALLLPTLARFLLSCLALALALPLLIFSPLAFPSSPSSSKSSSPHHPPVTAPVAPATSVQRRGAPSGPDATTATTPHRRLLPPVRPCSLDLDRTPPDRCYHRARLRRPRPRPRPSTGIGGVFPASFPKGNQSLGFWELC